MASNLLIKGGVVVDGTRTARFISDILVRDGIIERIGRDLPVEDATEVIDATGRAVYPERYAYAGDYREGIAVVQEHSGLHLHNWIEALILRREAEASILRAGHEQGH